MIMGNKGAFKKPVEMVPGTLILKCLTQRKVAYWEGECKQSMERIYLPSASFAQAHELKGHGINKAQTQEDCTITSLTTVTMAIF